MAKILIVEGDESPRTFYKECLSLDYKPNELTFKATTNEAISELERMLYRSEEPTLVILNTRRIRGVNTGMPVIDYIKTNFPKTNVIVVAEELRGVKQTTLEKGASAFFLKPFDVHDFLDAVRAYATK